MVANTRIPYASTLQLSAEVENAPDKYAKDKNGIPHLGGDQYNPGASTMDPNAIVWQRAIIHDGKVHGEK